MAIIADTWNRLEYKSFANVAWTGLANPPSVPAAFVKQILAGSTIIGYIIADGDPFTVAIEGGVATLPAGVVNAESVVTGVVVTSVSSEVTAWVQDVDGTLYNYGLSSGVVQHFDLTNKGYLNTVSS